VITLPRLATLLCCAVLTGCGVLHDETAAIRLAADPSGEDRAVFEFAVRGSPMASRDASENDAVYTVRVAPDSLDGLDPKAELPPLAGKWSNDGDVVRFRPRFPLQPGLCYRAEFRPVDGAPIVKEFVWQPGAKKAAVAPEVTALFPSGEHVPANLLKLYVHFSQPMSTGEVYGRIRLLDAKGDEVAHPFLELEEELRSRDGTRVTVFFDPGRVKRELRPNAEVGPALVDGRSYTIDIDAAWQSAEGVPLAKGYRKKILVVAPDREAPDPKTWIGRLPFAGTRDPLVFAFPEPLDHALLERLLWVRGPDGVEVDGLSLVGDRERVWSFRPATSWVAGVHHLVMGTILEDLAGNSIAKVFEVDVFREIRAPVASKEVSLEFTVLEPSRREP
jgi:hypothetical protein